MKEGIRKITKIAWKNLSDQCPDRRYHGLRQNGSDQGERKTDQKQRGRRMASEGIIRSKKPLGQHIEGKEFGGGETKGRYLPKGGEVIVPRPDYRVEGKP